MDHALCIYDIDAIKLYSAAVAVFTSGWPIGSAWFGMAYVAFLVCDGKIGYVKFVDEC